MNTSCRRAHQVSRASAQLAGWRGVHAIPLRCGRGVVAPLPLQEPTSMATAKARVMATAMAIVK